MRHQEYIARRSEQDPNFRLELAIATAELKLATAIAERRLSREISVGEVAEATGISVERLEAIEEGDNVTIAEALRIAHALDITIGIEPSFQLSAVPATSVALQH